MTDSDLPAIPCAPAVPITVQCKLCDGRGQYTESPGITDTCGACNGAGTYVRLLADALIEEATALLREIAQSGVEFEDGRVGYMTIQVERETMDRIRAWFLAETGAWDVLPWPRQASDVPNLPEPVPPLAGPSIPA